MVGLSESLRGADGVPSVADPDGVGGGVMVSLTLARSEADFESDTLCDSDGCCDDDGVADADPALLSVAVGDGVGGGVMVSVAVKWFVSDKVCDRRETEAEIVLGDEAD
jgi:hypothetical protein